MGGRVGGEVGEEVGGTRGCGRLKDCLAGACCGGTGASSRPRSRCPLKKSEECAARRSDAGLLGLGDPF